MNPSPPPFCGCFRPGCPACLDMDRAVGSALLDVALHGNRKATRLIAANVDGVLALLGSSQIDR